MSAQPQISTHFQGQKLLNVQGPVVWRSISAIKPGIKFQSGFLFLLFKGIFLENFLYSF